MLSLDERARAGRSCCAPGSRPATAAASSPSATRGSGSCRSATPTASGATSPAREVLVAGERRRVVGTVSMDAFAVELDRELPVGHARDARRPRPAARGARARRRHDHLRARLRHRLVTDARAAHGGRRADRTPDRRSRRCKQERAAALAAHARRAALADERRRARARRRRRRRRARVCARAARTRGGRASTSTRSCAARARERRAGERRASSSATASISRSSRSRSTSPATLRTLHHTRAARARPRRARARDAAGRTILVVDQLAPVDPLAAFELNRFERARDPSTTRCSSGRRPARALRREQPRAAAGASRRTSRVTSTPTSTSRAARASSASARDRSHRPATSRSSAGTCSSEPSRRHKRLHHGRGAYQRGTVISRRSCSMPR